MRRPPLAAHGERFRLALFLFLPAVALTLPPSAQSADDVTGLIEKLPGPMNVVAVVRLSELLQSPRAKQEGWAQKYEHGYADGAVSIPPVVDVLVYGSDLHSGGNRMAERRGIVRLNWKEAPSLAEIARRQKGRTMFVAKTPVVFSPRFGFGWQLEPKVMALLPTADRQELARWIRAMDDKSRPPISEYLAGAMERMRTAQIVIAIDAADMIHPEALRQWVLQSESAKDDPATAKKAAAALENLVGLQLGVEVLLKTRGLVRFDLPETVDEATASMIQKLFLEWVSIWGAMIDDLQYCTVRAVDKAVVLEMPLSNDGLRRVMTLIQVPAPEMPASSPSTAQPPSAEEVELAASLKYYNAVQTLLSDLQKLYRKATNYDRTALWHDNYARRIDQLPVENVDSQLVDWGMSVAGNLRSLSASLRGVPYTMNLLESQKYSNDYFIPGYTVQYGTYGWAPGTYLSDNNFGEIRAKQAQAIADGDTDRGKIWDSIDSSISAVRQKMYERFGVDFDNPKKKR